MTVPSRETETLTETLTEITRTIVTTKFDEFPFVIFLVMLIEIPIEIPIEILIETNEDTAIDKTTNNIKQRETEIEDTGRIIGHRAGKRQTQTVPTAREEEIMALIMKKLPKSTAIERAFVGEEEEQQVAGTFIWLFLSADNE